MKLFESCRKDATVPRVAANIARKPFSGIAPVDVITARKQPIIATITY